MSQASQRLLAKAQELLRWSPYRILENRDTGERLYLEGTRPALLSKGPYSIRNKPGEWYPVWRKDDDKL